MPKQMEIDFFVAETKKNKSVQRMQDLWADSRVERAAQRATDNVKRSVTAGFSTPRIGEKMIDKAPNQRSDHH